MNLIDELVSYFDPMAGVRRFQARMALDVARSYDAAKVGRRTEGWNAGSGSANTEILPAVARVRNRCREVVRNNEYAAKAINTLSAAQVGTGVTAKAADQNVWNAWTQECDADGQLDFNGCMELAARTRHESGSVLIRFRQRRPEDGLRVPLQIQVLEPDHLDLFKTGPMNNGNFAIGGVEFNSIGQRVAYWLYPVHPGEAITGRANGLESKRVPATEVLHYYRKRRPSQVLGMPELGVSLLRLRNLADYEEAELVRKKIEACFVAFVRTDSDATRLGDAKKDAQGLGTNERVSPGMIKYLSNAEGVEFGAPAASGGYGEYTATQLHAIAAGAGVTHEQLTGDLSRVNYSSIRAGLMEFRELIAQEQWLAFVPMVLNPIARRFQETAILAGVQRGPAQQFTWTMPKREWVDPLKDVLAIKEAIRGGMMSLSEAIRARGDDPEAVMQEIATERGLLKTLAVLVDSDAAVSERLISEDTAAKLIQAE
ncbi:phage portal protein [Herbaspirillum sp. ST 5-3]|uniref:phage portal protein n=1 Tax=Oxalobacteraceae TaxID=75682 RepID=UPI0010A3E46A|nr:phage portal protein [Herbaspirillum sp. ST 5-3]